jgi:hypothetical protein
LFDDRGGNYRYWRAEVDRCSTGNCRAVNDPSAPLEEQAAAVARTTGSLFNTDAGYLKLADFTRWREASVSYVLPKTVLKYIRAPGGNIVLTGRNLKMISTKWIGLDPEGANYDFWIDNDANWTPPPLRYWTARFNINY